MKVTRQLGKAAGPGELHGKIRALVQVVDMALIPESVAFHAIRGLVS